MLGPRPLLAPNQVAWLGVEDDPATDWERQEARRLGLHVASSDDLALDPIAAAFESLRISSGPLAVHVDVDVLDFIDAPLAENTDGRNKRDPLWIRSEWRLKSQSETSVFEHCRLESSIRPGARGIRTRFPVSLRSWRLPWLAFTASQAD